MTTPPLLKLLLLAAATFGLLRGALTAAPAAAHPAADTVVLLHGLGRGPASLTLVARTLRQRGYRVVTVAYPSRHADIATLAERALGPIFEASENADATGRTHIVTHSLGGILVRQYLRDHGVPPALGRVVMLAPPNAGSEIVDTLETWPLYARLNGPAGLDLGTAADHAPARLGPLPPAVEVGVIAGSFSWNPVFSALIAGPDDGKVSVARTHVAGEADHLTLPYSHTWLMNRRETRRQVDAFLRDGRFDHWIPVRPAAKLSRKRQKNVYPFRAPLLDAGVFVHSRPRSSSPNSHDSRPRHLLAEARHPRGAS